MMDFLTCKYCEKCLTTDDAYAIPYGEGTIAVILCHRACGEVNGHEDLVPVVSSLKELWERLNHGNA